MCVCLMMISNKSQKQLKKKKKNLVRTCLSLPPPLSREFKYRFISYIFCPADLPPTHLCPCPSVGAARPSCPIIIIIIMTTPTSSRDAHAHAYTDTRPPEQVHAHKQCVARQVFFICSFFFLFVFYSAKC